MKKTSKILTFLLLVLMLSAVFAVTVFAEDTTAEEGSIPTDAAIEHTDADGVVTYYTEDQFASAFSIAGTVKLLKNIDIECDSISITQNITLDLNGCVIRRVYYWGNFYNATDNGDGTFECGTDSLYKDATKYDAGEDLFKIENEITFTITSSVENGAIYNAVMKADSWFNGDTVVKRTILGSSPSALVSIIPTEASNSVLNINGGVSVYSQCLIYQYAGYAENCTISIDNIKHHRARTSLSNGSYNTHTSIYIGTKYGIEVNITNSLFSMPNTVTDTFLRIGTEDNGTGTINICFTNCDIIKKSGSYGAGITCGRTDSSNVRFIDCRTLDLGSTSFAALGEKTIYNGTLSGVKNAAPLTGYEEKTLTANVTKKYTGIPSTGDAYAYYFTYDSEATIQSPLFDKITTKDYTLAFNRIISKPVTVNWSHEGQIIQTDVIYPGVDSLTPPELDPYVLEDDAYRNIAYQWADAAENGNALPDALGWEDSYTYYAVTELNGVIDYVAGLKGAMFNMSYMAHFRYAFYLPIVEGVTIDSVSGLRDEAYSAYISNAEYNYWIDYVESTEALNSTTVTVQYTIEGEQYTANLDISAYIYATLSVSDPNHTANDKEAAGCLIRYIEESYKLVDEDHILDEETQTKFDAFYEKYTPADYVTEYPEAEIKDYNEAAVEGLIESVQFACYNGARIGFVVTLTDEAVANGYQVFFSGVSYGIGNSRESGKVWYTNNVAIWKYIMNTNYSIEICTADSTTENATVITRDIDTDGDGVTESVKAKTNYTLATYCKETDNSLGKSLYAFGKAILAVREEIYQ